MLYNQQEKKWETATTMKDKLDVCKQKNESKHAKEGSFLDFAGTTQQNNNKWSSPLLLPCRSAVPAFSFLLISQTCLCFYVYIRYMQVDTQTTSRRQQVHRVETEKRNTKYCSRSEYIKCSECVMSACACVFIILQTDRSSRKVGKRGKRFLYEYCIVLIFFSQPNDNSNNKHIFHMK